MKTSITTAFIALLALHGALQAAPLETEQWHELSLRILGGTYTDGISVESGPYHIPMERPTFVGLGLAWVLTDDSDLVFDLIKTEASGSYRNDDNSETAQAQLDTGRLSITGRKMYPLLDSRFLPWIGAGIDLTKAELDTDVAVSTGGQAVTRSDDIDDIGLGLHATGGMIFYPVPESSLGLALEAGYTAYPDLGKVDASLDGWTILVGIQWDFWQRGL